TPVSSMVPRDSSGVAAVLNQRNETGLGVCLAITHGRGNLCDDSDRVWFGPSAALRSRIKRDGSSDRNHAGDRRDRFVGGQNFVLTLGTFSSPALGNRASVGARCRPPFADLRYR